MRCTHMMKMDLPAGRWNDAIPLGNGTLGALLYGNVARDTIVLNHENLWLPVYPERRMGEAFIDYSVVEDGEFKTVVGTYRKDGRQFANVMRTVRRGSECIVLVSVLAPGDAATADTEARRLAALDPDFDALLTAHVVEHRALYARVSFRLGDASCLAGRSNEELLLKAYSGEVPLALYERMFNYSRYLFISSVGKLPPNLQGVWNGNWNPTWSCDYTLDENIQMNYWQALQGSFPESCHAYFDFFERQLPDWRENARQLFNCRGVHAPIKSTTHGNNYHVLPGWPWHFWHSTAGWLAQLWHEYYVFTNDVTFLRERVIPLYAEIAAFYEDFLVEEGGYLQFIPSVSPENTPKGRACKTTVNATIEIAVAREVLDNLIRACRQTGMHPEHIETWQSMVDRLPPYAVNADGALKEWLHPDLQGNYNHRHQSQISMNALVSR